MTIEFLTQDDPLYILPFFETFFRDYPGEFRIGRISACRTMGRRPRRQMLRELLGLYRPVGMARLLARVVSSRTLALLPRAKGSGRYYSIGQLARAYGIPYHKTGNPNDAEFVDALDARKPDLLVSVACPYILKERLLALPRLGCINIHHAPLPRFKGMMPTFWQMFHGEKEVGITIHYMTDALDDGNALLQESLAIAPGESLDHLIRRSKQHGAHCMARVLRQIAANTHRAVPLDRSWSSRFTFPTAEEIREFHRRGFRAV
jgi:methionyl-tRNA formyltransferase